MRLDPYIQTSRRSDLSVTYSLSSDAVGASPAEILSVRANPYWISLFALDTGTVDVTLTVTAPDGKSEQQTFTVTVVNDLQSNEIVFRDPLAIEEGYSVVDLSAYFTGPPVGEIEFTAASSNPNVAPVSLDGGRLLIAAGSTGEAQITVRADYLGRVKEQTFTIVVTDECPTWLCRGTFSGWRSTLLGTTEADDTQTDEGQ